MRISGLLVAVLVLQAVRLSAQDRMPPIPADKMTDAQKKAVADYKDIRRADLTGPPWSVILRVPDLVVPSLQLRLHNLNNSALSRKLTELAILIAARHWTNNYEWNAHDGLATTAGLSPAIIAATADGRRPTGMAEDEEILYDFCAELLHNQSVSDPTYAKALAKFSLTGLARKAITPVDDDEQRRSPIQTGADPLFAPFPKWEVTIVLFRPLFSAIRGYSQARLLQTVCYKRSCSQAPLVIA